MTNSRIAVHQQDGSVKSIYCNFDGYLDGVGSTLYNNYNTLEKINPIMEIGNIITLYLNPRYIIPYGKSKCLVHDNIDDYNNFVGKETFNYLFKDVWYYMKDGSWTVLNKKLSKRK